MRLRILGALLLLAGTLAGAETPVGTPPTIAGSLDGLIFDGSRFVLTQSGARTFLADDGTQLPAGIAAAGGETAALASSGRGYLSVSVSRGGAYATRLNARGEVMDTFMAAQGATAAALQWDGARYVLAWSDEHRVNLSFISDRVDNTIEVAGNADAFALAARNGVALVVWSSGGSLFGRTTDSTPARIGDGTLSDVAAGKDGFLVTALSGGMLVARHVDLAGHPDATYPVAPSARGARLARERYAYVLAWPDGHNVLGERIDPIGGTTHGPFVVAALDRPVDDVAVASNTATTLVAYSSASAGIFAKQVDDTSPGRPMRAHVARQWNVRAAGSFVAWQQEIDGGSEIRVNDAVVASGTDIVLEDVAAEPGVATIVWRDAANRWSLRYPVETAPHVLTAPRGTWDPMQIASNGVELLAVSNDGGRIVAQSLNGDGPTIVVDGSALQKGTPHVRWDGAAWLVTWPEIVDAATAGFASMRIGGAKTYIAKAPLPLSLDDWSGDAHAVYYVRDGRLFVQKNDAARRRAAGR